MKGLLDKLQTLILSGCHDSGFPVVRKDEGGSRMVGYIGANELEYALNQEFSLTGAPDIVADHPSRIVTFHSTTPYGHAGQMASSFSSTNGDASSIMGGADPFDFSYYMDQVCCNQYSSCSRADSVISQAPLTVQSNSPLELVQQLFTKLGARYIIVIDADGYCAFLS